MSVEEAIQAVRTTAALFDADNRGLLQVSGDDRVRWLDGMISGDVAALEAGADGAGCYATLLTNRGAIVADLHVARIGETFLLGSLRSEIPRIAETLDRFIIADDVVLEDRSEDFAVLALEGPSAPTILAAALSRSTDVPEPDHWRAAEIAGQQVVVGAFGVSGEAAFVLFVSAADEQARATVETALDSAAGGSLVRGEATALEILRIEAGTPALGLELDEEVLPPEARLERAISTTKGCYVGQEIVARLRARGQVNHLLVGLRLDGDALPEAGVELSVAGKKTGEITSVARSPSEGAIALGYVRREHADPGARVAFEGGAASVAGLPFVTPTSEADSA